MGTSFAHSLQSESNSLFSHNNNLKEDVLFAH